MKTLINYIRSCFCKHEWKLIDKGRVKDFYGDVVGMRWTYRCSKCNYHKTYKNY